MSPEQIFGLEADPRSDLYALGCVGYWLVAGAKPFEADSPGELMRRHAQEAPPSLSERGRRAVPERFEAAILSCLSKQPEDRPRDADCLADLLAASLDGEPWTEADARAWWEANLPAT
jgi:serine/threonine-protein kinase